jgi:hypothetical protein
MSGSRDALLTRHAKGAEQPETSGSRYEFSNGRKDGHVRRFIVFGVLAACAGASLYPVHAGAQQPTCNGKVATTPAYGTDGDDVFVGGEGNDRFYDGGGGNDTVCGGGGHDHIYAGPGNDYVDAGPGNDRVSSCNDPFSLPESCGIGEDADTFLGGTGDDALFGFGDSDSIDAGEGFDAVDGGDGTDACVAGERYEGCESTDPPEPPAACSDATDNDGDGNVDSADPGCARPRDPTEDVARDPKCSNGNDDDGDGFRDYPADRGCAAPSDNGEYECADDAVCARPSLYARYRRDDRVFKGGILADRVGCRTDRLVLVKRLQRGPNEVVARARARADGRWRVRRTVPEGSYIAVAPRWTYVTPEGDEPGCQKLRSQRMKTR